MEQLPMEIYDRIVHYVGHSTDHPVYDDHLIHPRIISLHNGARTALGNLRLVSKKFNCSASRALFRGVHVRLGHGISSIPKLKALSSSEYAKYVRLLQVDIEGTEQYGFVEDQEDEAELEEDEEEDIDGESVRSTDNDVEPLSEFVAQFRNLMTVNIWPGEFEEREKATELLSQCIVMIADLQHRGFIRKVTDLRIPIDGAVYLMELLNCDEHKSAVQHLLRHMQHLDFIGCIGYENGDYVPMGLINFDTLLQSSPNLLSIGLFGDDSSISLVKYNPDLKLQLESLELVSVKIAAYDILALLETCKESMRYISLDHVELLSGTWLHVLVQIKKSLQLITFFFMASDPYLEALSYKYCGSKTIFVSNALGDIQRQTNANRIAAGLKPWTKKTYLYLDSVPLEHRVSKALYKNFTSRDWDAEKNET